MKEKREFLFSSPTPTKSQNSWIHSDWTNLAHAPINQVDRGWLRLIRAYASELGAGSAFFKPLPATQWRRGGTMNVELLLSKQGGNERPLGREKLLAGVLNTSHTAVENRRVKGQTGKKGQLGDCCY